MISRTGVFPGITFRTRHILKITAGEYKYCRKKQCQYTPSAVTLYTSLRRPKCIHISNPLPQEKFTQETFVCMHLKSTHTHTHTHLTYPWPLLSWLKLHWVKSEREDSDINSRYKTKALSPQPQQFVIFSINTLQGNSSSRFFLSLLIFLWEKITSAWSWRWLVNDGLTRTINITSQQNPLKE